MDLSENTAEGAAETTKAETDRLVAEMEALPTYRGWTFSYEYPGYFCYRHPENNFCYRHPENSYSVFFTPDWDEDATLPIQVQIDDDRDCPEYSDHLPLTHEGRTGQAIFEMVRPTLDKILGGLTKAEREALANAVLVPGELRVYLTKVEIEALKMVHEHVRVHMAHEHPWEIRDTAMGAISKVLTAARDALP